MKKRQVMDKKRLTGKLENKLENEKKGRLHNTTIPRQHSVHAGMLVRIRVEASIGGIGE